MPFNILELPPPTFYGVDADLYARNGQVPDGIYFRSIARGINHVLARHGTIIPGKSVLPTNTYVYASSPEARLWTTRYCATPNHTTLVSQIVFLKSDPDHLAGPSSWYIKVDADAQPTRYHARYRGIGATATLDDVFVETEEITIAASGGHTVSLYVGNYAEVLGWYLYEKDTPTLDGAGSTMVRYAEMLPGRPMYDSSIQELYKGLTKAWDQQRGAYFSWNADDPTAPVAATSTPTNIWDGSTLVTATTIGPRVPTRYRATYTGTQIPVECWVYAARTAGVGTATASFIYSGGEIEVSVDGAARVWTATGYIDQLDDGEKIDVLWSAPAGTSADIYACGMYPFGGF